VDDVDARLERTNGELLDRRRPSASICPAAGRCASATPR
jgi:hypothetical protein